MQNRALGDRGERDVLYSRKDAEDPTPPSTYSRSTWIGTSD